MPQQTLTVSGITATVRVRNQGTSGSGGSWTVGNTAPIGGTLVTDYVDGTSIQFLTNAPGDVFALNTGNYRPNPAAFNPASTNTANPDGQYSNTSTAPAVFGGRIHVAALGGLVSGDAGVVSFSDVLLNVLTTSVLPIAGDTFNSAGIQVGIDSSLVNFDGFSLPVAGQVIPDAVQSPFTNIFAANAAGSSTVEDLGGGVRRLTLNINIPNLQLDFDGTLLSAGISGKIVALALIPEPTTIMLVGLGLAGLAVHGRRRQ